MITGLDHFVILVNDLEAAMESYSSLGFYVQPGGEHKDFGSRNALIPLIDGTYLELLAFTDTTLAAKTFWGEAVKKLQVREGFDGYAVQSNAIQEDVELIRRRGLKMSDPQPGERVRPDDQSVRWRTARSTETFSSILPFLIQDDTPRTLRIEPAHEGLGSHTRVKELVVAVKSPEVARGAFRELLGIEPRPVKNSAGDVQGYRVPATWASIVLAYPERGGNALADQLSRRGEGLYALTMSVEDVARLRSETRARGVPIEEEPRGFMISPAAARGARLRFVQS